ncbi:replication initiation protein RepC [Rhizobiales bacterium GAS113]|nr:replication initiation protein RepC [Rhizobiales bacterium GAS113]
MSLEACLPGHRPRSRSAATARARVQPTPPSSVSRSDLIAATKTAARVLRLRGGRLAVLEKLVSCYGAQVGNQLLVYPSNRYLARATGLDERSIRRALASLIEHGLILPKDSARRNRYARRDQSGAVVDAFGFDLAPLWARRQEFQWSLEKKLEHEDDIRCDDLKIGSLAHACRAALAAAALHDPAGRCAPLAAELNAILAVKPRRGRPGDRAPIIVGLEELSRRADALFIELSATEAQDADKSSEFDIIVRVTRTKCPPIRKVPNNSIENGKAQAQNQPRHNSDKSDRACGAELSEKKAGEPVRHTERSPGCHDIATDILHQACPDLVQLCGPVETLAHLIAAGTLVRASFGASPDAWQEGLRSIGAVPTALLSIYVYQLACDDARQSGPPISRGRHGGLFRSLIRKTAARTFDIERAFLTLRRKRFS